MKTIKSILLLIMLCVTVISSSWKCIDKKRTITLRALDEIVTPALLKESAGIISLRLTTYGLDTFSLNIDAEKEQIAVTVPADCNIGDVCNLVTQRGVIALYETYDKPEAIALLNDDKLFDKFTSTDIRIGYITAVDTAKVNNALKSKIIPDNMLFRWGLVNEKSQVSLFALKREGNPLLVRSDFESISCSGDGRISVTLKHEYAKKWADATTANLNKSIAILIDNKVISDPIVRQRMDSGKFEITGDYSKREAGFFTALLADGTLPLTFIIVK